MRFWTVEYGVLWALETDNGLPPIYPAQVEVSFQEIDGSDLHDLTAVMELPDSKLIQQRFQGNRRCFALKTAGEIIAYGWASRGSEYVGELERHFHLQEDEVYIWDCKTMPAWRGQHCYSTLLSHMIHQISREETKCIWIGASRLNQPSIRGIANAGFKSVVDITYRRIFHLTLMWFHRTSSNHPHLVKDAYRILVNPNQRRLGKLAIGIKR